jgi:hypothetical protein
LGHAVPGEEGIVIVVGPAAISECEGINAGIVTDLASKGQHRADGSVERLGRAGSGHLDS